MRQVCVLLIISLYISTLAACSTNSINVSDSNILDAKSKGIPILIYQTSWNDPYGWGMQRMEVRFLNTSNMTIHVIKLFVAGCGAKGTIEDFTYPLTLRGPFQSNVAYSVKPSFPLWKSQWLSHDQIVEAAKRSSHMVIRRVEIEFTGNSKTVYKNNDVSGLLTGNISNFCRSSFNLNLHGNTASQPMGPP